MISEKGVTMGITILSLVLLVPGIFLYRWAEQNNREGWEVVAMALVCFGAIGVLLSGLMIVSTPYGYQVTAAERMALATTLEVARTTGVKNIENAAILIEIAKFNTDIAKRKYYRGLFWTSWFESKKILSMEPIR
jgi:hypothetical protein